MSVRAMEARLDIGAWLRGLGLESYEPAFRANEIDSNVLSSLTAEDLKDLGVTLVGHRRRLLEAIAALRADANAALTSSGPGAPGPPAAERRQLTLMFCDLVDSTMLSERLDPEELRGVLAVYQKECAALIARFGGFVAQYQGDGVLAYFGYPLSQEDDAERAVRAGMAIGEAVGRLTTTVELKLQTRIAIATGLVVVGDLIGDGMPPDPSVVGETPNLAARLQSMAEPDTLVIAESTKRLVGGLFRYRDLGKVILKGFSRQVSAWQVLGASSIDSRFEAQHEAGITGLVGREEELDLVLRRWGQVQTSEGRVVVLSGEPGIGKSRIVREIRDRLADALDEQLGYFCSPHNRDSALYPVMTQLARSAGITRDDAPDERLIKLEALLGQSMGAEDVALIAAQLAIPTGDRYPSLSLSPQRRKEKTLEALLAYLTTKAAQNPALVVYEDVHWIDPTSLELLTLLVERSARLSILLIITARPEFIPPWPAYAHITILPLTRLSRRDGAVLSARVAGGKPLPKELLDQILERTDGVPLFIEELTKTVLEGGMLQEETERYVLNGPLQSLAIPTTLHASLMARLDRLAPAREIAQIGAAIGREFPYVLLRAVAPLREEALRGALEQLVAAGLVFQRGSPPDALYIFKHVLVQDAAYDTLLRHTRHDLHGRIVAALEESFPEVVNQQPEILAQHCAQAGMIERAIAYWSKAGHQSVVRSAMTEAVGQLRKGISLLASVSDAARRKEQELELQICLGSALIATEGYAAAVTGAAYTRARQLCEELERPEQLVPVLYGEWTHHIHRDELDQARELAAEARRLAETRNDAAIRLTAYRISGVTCFFRGEFSECRDYQEQGLALFDPSKRPAYTAVADARVIFLAFLSRALLHLGHIEQAQARSGEALDEARKLSHAYTQSWALWQACFVDWIVRPQPALMQRTEALIRLSREQNFRYSEAVGTLFRGWCLSSQGQHEEGLALLEQGLADYRITGTVGYLSFFLTLLAEAYGKVRRPDAGLNELTEAASLIEATQERWAEAETHRVRGELLVGINRYADAEASFRRAITVAERQDAKLWELRAATCLGRLFRDQGRRAEARGLLLPLYHGFSEGSATRSLREAKELLENLD
jgi:class 3 adenylate cyclase/predicted ATPase